MRYFILRDIEVFYTSRYWGILHFEFNIYILYLEIFRYFLPRDIEVFYTSRYWGILHFEIFRYFLFRDIEVFYIWKYWGIFYLIIIDGYTWYIRWFLISKSTLRTPLTIGFNIFKKWVRWEGDGRSQKVLWTFLKENTSKSWSTIFWNEITKHQKTIENCQSFCIQAEGLTLNIYGTGTGGGFFLR